MEQNPALSMAAEYVEVCFPAWPARKAVALPLAARLSHRLSAGPLELAAFVAAAVAVPGAIAALSVVVLALLVAFVVFAPVSLALVAWAAWWHDHNLTLDRAPTR